MPVFCRGRTNEAAGIRTPSFSLARGAFYQIRTTVPRGLDGICTCLAALTFHHLDPSEKEFSLCGNDYNRKWKDVLEEEKSANSSAKTAMKRVIARGVLRRRNCLVRLARTDADGMWSRPQSAGNDSDCHFWEPRSAT